MVPAEHPTQEMDELQRELMNGEPLLASLSFLSQASMAPPHLVWILHVFFLLAFVRLQAVRMRMEDEQLC